MILELKITTKTKVISKCKFSNLSSLKVEKHMVAQHESNLRSLSIASTNSPKKRPVTRYDKGNNSGSWRITSTAPTSTTGIGLRTIALIGSKPSSLTSQSSTARETSSSKWHHFTPSKARPTSMPARGKSSLATNVASHSIGRAKQKIPKEPHFSNLTTPLKFPKYSTSLMRTPMRIPR